MEALSNIQGLACRREENRAGGVSKALSPIMKDVQPKPLSKKEKIAELGVEQAGQSSAFASSGRPANWLAAGYLVASPFASVLVDNLAFEVILCIA